MKQVFNKIADKLFRKQWNIGVAKMSIAGLIKDPSILSDLTWFPILAPDRFFADPFLFKGPGGEIYVIYEDYNIHDHGKISVSKVTPDLKYQRTKQILDTGRHLSYPNVIVHEGKTLIMPEASADGGVIIYEFDFQTRELINPVTLIPEEPLLDSTILFHDGLYWLFATKRGSDSNNLLFIYHSDSLMGPYEPHVKNPVKNSLKGSRPAGNFIFVNGEIYRPSQDCADYYGKSIVINRLLELTKTTFREEVAVEIHPPKKGGYQFGIHTINVVDDVIVIDALRRVFMPVEQINIYFKKLFKKKKFTAGS